MTTKQAIKDWTEYHDKVTAASPGYRKVMLAGATLIEVAHDHAQLMRDFRETQKRLQNSDRETARWMAKAKLLEQVRDRLDRENAELRAAILAKDKALEDENAKLIQDNAELRRRLSD